MKLFRFLRLLGLAAIAIYVVGFASAAKTTAGELNVEAQLLWGTNDETSPNPKHKAVDPALAKKLSKMPLKWKNFFEEERKVISIAQGTSRKVKMSESCELELKNVGKNVIEANLYGKGKRAGKRTGFLGGDDVFVIGGDAENDTAWFIVLRRVPAGK